MKIKTYQAGSMVELFDQAREDLGPSAVILWVRRVADERAFGKHLFEGAAAVDLDNAPEASAESARPEPARPAPAPREEPRTVRAIVADAPVQAPSPAQSARGPRRLPETLVTRTDASIHCMVGATNSGKTLSAAKFAVLLRERVKLPVGILSIDASNLRGNANLQKFAAKEGFPFATARTASELLEHIRAWDERGPVVLDTPGVRPQEVRAMAQILNVLKKAGYAVAVHLAVRVDENPGACLRALNDFVGLGFDDVIPIGLGDANSNIPLLEMKAWGARLLNLEAPATQPAGSPSR
ncbi:MAG: hypothetical protein KIS92_07450 [Planctomycetota bacterium]|nr:hypothetical protein [Planctomycetota bacterium]